MENLREAEKSRLRDTYKRIRASIDTQHRSAMDEAFIATLKVLPEVEAGKVFFVYLSRNGEASTGHLVQVLLEAGKTVLTPSPDIRALPHHGLFQVHLEGSGKGHTAPALCAECRVSHVDVIVVPGIAWDRDGYRVGFGGGYFDRLLAMARPDCFKIGLAYDCQIVARVPRDPWDEPVDLLVTETETIRVVDKESKASSIIGSSSPPQAL